VTRGRIQRPDNGDAVQCYQLTSILKTASSGFTVPGFDTTPNPGGEYKVWVSKDPNFDPSQSKTDNFKVKILDEQIPPPEDAELCVEKFYDVNVNGTFEEGTDIPITGWMVFITGDANLVRFTPSCTIVEPGTYNVTEAEPLENHWIHTTGTARARISVASPLMAPTMLRAGGTSPAPPSATK